VVRGRWGCGPTPGIESFRLCAPPQRISSSPAAAAARPPILQRASSDRYTPARPELCPRWGGMVPTHGSVCHRPGGNGNQGEARALKNTPAELTRLSRKQTRRYGGSGQPIGSSARGERAAPNGGSPNLTKFFESLAGQRPTPINAGFERTQPSFDRWDLCEQAVV
jgi:hypothetical protein